VREDHHLSIDLTGDFSSESSFRELNDQYLRAFRALGCDVRFRERASVLCAGDPADLLFVHPGWSAGDFNGAFKLHERFKVAGFKDVLNYSDAGPSAAAEIENPAWDFIAMPHVPPPVRMRFPNVEFVKWPDGVPEEFDPGRYPLTPRTWQRPRVLIWADNPGFERKGHDLHRELLAQAQEAGAEFDTYIKSRWVRRVQEVFADVKRKTIIPHYLDRDSMRRLFDNVDVLVHLHRGGGWELVPMEAAARGVSCIVPDAGACLEYAMGPPFWRVKTKRWTPTAEALQASGWCDAGYGYEADVHELVDPFVSAVDRRDPLHWMETGPKSAATFYAKWEMARLVEQNLRRLCQTVKLRL